MADTIEYVSFLDVSNSHKGARLRRFVDLVLASAAAVIFSPLMMLIAIAIWFESGAPVFFSQARVGFQGREFRMHKFRKFRRDCSPTGHPLTMENDSRLTRVGAILEATKLDELPQLWNIIVGSMSIVGPRPETLDFSDCFTNGYENLLVYKPGIFGPSQVAFRHESSLFLPGHDPCVFYRTIIFPAKAKMDLAYYSSRSISSDLGWIIRGTLAVFNRTPCPQLGPPGV